MLQHVIVPLDESELAENAIPYARQLLPSDGKLTLLAVVDVPAYPYMLTPGPYPVPVESNTEIYEKMVKQMTEHAREYLHKVGDSLKESGLEVALRVTTGHPADCIVASADELNADAIVMSTHGRSGISRWVYGSVTQKVLSVAHLPVMVIPPKREAR